MARSVNHDRRRGHARRALELVCQARETALQARDAEGPLKVTLLYDLVYTLKAAHFASVRALQEEEAKQ